MDEYKITQIEYHYFQSYSNDTFSNNDEIRINNHNWNIDGYTLPCENYIHIGGKINELSYAKSKLCFTKNGLEFIFSEIRYKLNGLKSRNKRNIKYSGMSPLKGYCLYTPNNLYVLENIVWDINIQIEGI